MFNQFRERNGKYFKGEMEEQREKEMSIIIYVLSHNLFCVLFFLLL